MIIFYLRSSKDESSLTFCPVKACKFTNDETYFMRTKLFILLFLNTFLLFSGNKNKSLIIENNLRAPAYPLITIDPYTSGWSFADNLYDGSVKHWTGKDFPLIGAVKVDGKIYRFMGTEELEFNPLVPTSEQGEWFGKYTETEPADNWTAAVGFDDSGWREAKGAFGTTDSEPTAKTHWQSERIWVRRVVNIDCDLTGKNVYLEYTHDDGAKFYINGLLAFDTGNTCNKNAMVKLSPEIVKTLVKGKSLITAECHNPVANGLLDFGLLVEKDKQQALKQTAVQKSVDVQATQTRYSFVCGNVDLNLMFTAPLFMDNLDLMTRPVNYISYEVKSNDKKEHDVELYFEASPRWALDQPYEQSVSNSFSDDQFVYLKTGSAAQNILNKRGDDVRIDWGYFYMVAQKGNAKTEIGNSADLRNGFVKGSTNKNQGIDENSKMALIQNLGKVKNISGKIMIGYDDIYSIQYFGENLRPYWNRNNNKTIVSQFKKADSEYDKLMVQCTNFDKKLMEEATKAGGKKYAELCALAYRQAITAHKLVQAPNGDLLFLSKENFSNGSIGTVDVTYPSAPMFLYYNPELAKGLLNHIFYYSESGKWKKPFPAHDVGTYPHANGQTYGGDMPVEESGNMLILTAAIAKIEGNAAYVEKHWSVLTTWADYLVEKGLDPENQLCTDDFAGHFAHNTNLSVKAILGVASYGYMAKMLGKKEIAEKYISEARKMAQKWMNMADDGTHYRLTFDKPGTWSQKYNLVWDKLLKFDIFPKEVAGKEVKYYQTKQNEYGLPLDNRASYTKTDWIIWTATLASDKATFEEFINPLHLFMNETKDRIPMSDWTFTDQPYHRGFRARSVVGGYFVKMLEQKLK